ncbi:MAG: glutamate synthase domain-containing protein 2 [Candidatus Azotimanducaceae bacterium]|jgi:glutamate synthase domain-containing protein 2
MNASEDVLSSHHLEGGCGIVFLIDAAKYGARNLDGALNDKTCSGSSTPGSEIKLSQGANPGGSGLAPVSKVRTEIARVRGLPFGGRFDFA